MARFMRAIHAVIRLWMARTSRAMMISARLPLPLAQARGARSLSHVHWTCSRANACRSLSLPLRHRRIGPLGRAGIDLARAADLLVRVFQHLLPLRDPAHGAGQREQ